MLRSGPGGRYHFFAGRDGTRSLVTGCMDISNDECTRNSDSLEGLTDYQIGKVDSWLQYLVDKYKVVGILKKIDAG